MCTWLSLICSFSVFVCLYKCVFYVFFFKQKTAYEMRISDWSSDVCSSDLLAQQEAVTPDDFAAIQQALMSQGQGKPATEAAAKSAVPDAAPAATEGKANNGKGLVVEVQAAPPPNAAARTLVAQIGRTSCRERVCQ